MSSDRDSSPIELSEADLEQISGGIDFSLSGSIFEQQLSRRGRRRRRNAEGKIFSSAFQFSGSGFNSVEDVLSVIRELANLFGRRS